MGFKLLEGRLKGFGYVREGHNAMCFPLKIILHKFNEMKQFARFTLKVSKFIFRHSRTLPKQTKIRTIVFRSCFHKVDVFFRRIIGIRI